MGKGQLANRNEGLHSEYRGAVEAIGAGDCGLHEADMGMARFADVAVFASAVGPKNPMPARVENTRKPFGTRRLTPSSRWRYPKAGATTAMARSRGWHCGCRVFRVSRIAYDRPKVRRFALRLLAYIEGVAPA